MKKINKTGLVTAVAIAATALAPQMAAAHNVKKARSTSKVVSTSSAQSAMERRLEMMEQELAALRGELAKTRSEAKAEARATADKVAAHSSEVDEKLEAAKKNEQRDLLFFRGGYAAMEHARNNELLTNNDVTREALGLTQTADSKDGEGWYVGAGFDHRLTDDLWGISDVASVDGEVMFEYKNFGTTHNATVDSVFNHGVLNIPAGNTSGPSVIRNQLTQFTLTAAPKIKFNNMGDFRPWIIPFGLGIHVISPPSSGVTVLNPGLMVAAGAEYKIWQSLYAGFDFRYHFTGDDLNYKTKLPNGVTLFNKTDTDGFTTGAYLGFGF